MSDLNDNEKRGLPASIDLLRVAVISLENNPDSERRKVHLLNVINRVKNEMMEA